MASLQLDTLRPEDVQKVLRFMYILNDSFDNFENATLSALEDLFGYTISTYTIFEENIDGDLFIAKNCSNFFRKKELDYYGTMAYKVDAALKKAYINRSDNSSKYVIVTEYEKDSDNSFAQTMVSHGIRYQIRIGANTKVDTPIHILSVYKTFQSGDIDDYELELLATIGNCFSRCVGVYKQFRRYQKDTEMFTQSLDDEKIGFAFYAPSSNILNYNMSFMRYAGCIEKISYLPNYVNELVEEHKKAASIEPAQHGVQSVRELDEYTIKIRERLFTQKFEFAPYYVINIIKKDNPKPARAPQKKKYLDHDLTIREMEVCELIEEGLNNTEIMERLVISMPTVKTHIKNIFSKFGVSSRLELLKLLQSD